MNWWWVRAVVVLMLVVVGEGCDGDRVNGGGGPNDIFWYCFFLFISCAHVYVHVCVCMRTSKRMCTCLYGGDGNVRG